MVGRVHYIVIGSLRAGMMPSATSLHLTRRCPRHDTLLTCLVSVSIDLNRIILHPNQAAYDAVMMSSIVPSPLVQSSCTL
jgi:hypothetical protein